MAEFVPVVKLSELSDGSRLLHEVDDRIVVLFRLGEEIYCIDDVCTHDGGPLSDGQLDGYEIACPRHGAKFDIRNGCAKTMPATEDTWSHEVKVEGDEVFVRLRDADSAPRATNGAALAPLPPAVPLSAVGRNTSGEGTAASGDASATPAGSAASVATADTGPRVISEDFVREELRRVLDPELFVNIVDLGLIYVIDVLPEEDGRSKIKIDMTMTSPMCPAGPQLISQSKQVLTQYPEISGVEVRIVMDPPWGPDKMTEAARDQLGIF